MSALVVCARSRLDAALREHKPSRVVALRSPGAEPFAGFGLPERAALHLVFHDIGEDRPGLVSPTLSHIEALLAFARAWDRRAPLLVHCYAGVSRSPAAALLLAAALAPERDERELAGTLRRLSPEATPNPYLLRLADAALDRGGRLAEAGAEIGRGAEAFEGRTFRFPV